MGNRFYKQILIYWLAVLPVGVSAADRTTFVLAQTSSEPRENNSLPANALLPNELLGELPDSSWHAYMDTWKAHAANPADPSIRRFLGLPLDGMIEMKSTGGRSAPSWLGWQRGSYQQLESPQFMIYSRASDAETRQVAEDLQQCYWVWTQMFFPFWNERHRVSVALANWTPGSSIASLLASNNARLAASRRMRIVLFRDRNEYVQFLLKQVPGVEQSTGFYSDENQTTFLFAGDRETTATRRHELTHQMFREATSSPRRTPGAREHWIPGDDSGFWLIEGIAGYFESLYLGERYATVGGWDSSRLQYSRYRTLVGGEFLPISELQPDGRTEAQRREDLATYYAHSIAHTHRLLDRGDVPDRCWIYNQLAEIYRLDAPFKNVALPSPTLTQMQSFLRVNDPQIIDNPPSPAMERLCLAGCEVTAKGLSVIKDSSQLDWLDLSKNRAIDSETLTRLLAKPFALRQLSLEATSVDNRIAVALKQATQLEEIDVSFTRVSDEFVEAILGCKNLTTLWLTKTEITDRAMDFIESMPNLDVLDVQQTHITDERLNEFRKKRPLVKLNPLELRFQ